jgi:amino acid transporter
MHKLSTWQLVLLSSGGMIGLGWIFSPYYGFEVAGVGVLLSWLIAAIMILIIGLSFAEVVTLLPVVGGLARFIGITHNSTVSFVFLALGWLSYVVYLPLEVQSAVFYLSFWFKDLVVEHNNGATLSYLGLYLSFLIIIGLAWFNSLLINNVARVNSLVSIWKITVPISIAWLLITLFGNAENIHIANINNQFSFEKALLAVTSGGLAFAFTGFQNGLILANSAKNPKKAIPLSLFLPVIIGLILYSSLSLIYITCLGDKRLALTDSAPLFGLVALFNIHIIIAILFADVIVSPLGTANVYTASTARVLYGFAKDFFPDSMLNSINKFYAPSHCIWFNAFIGALFLLPFPTWHELVNLLSSIVIFSCLSGPISLVILRQQFPGLKRSFKLPCHKLIGYCGFVCCSLIMYWSELSSLIFLAILALTAILCYNILVERRVVRLSYSLKRNFFVLGYLLSLSLIKYIHQIKLVTFPIDNLLVIMISLIACKIFVVNKVNATEISDNFLRFSNEKRD